MESKTRKHILLKKLKKSLGKYSKQKTRLFKFIKKLSLRKKKNT